MILVIKIFLILIIYNNYNLKLFFNIFKIYMHLTSKIWTHIENA